MYFVVTFLKCVTFTVQNDVCTDTKDNHGPIFTKRTYHLKMDLKMDLKIDFISRSRNLLSTFDINNICILKYFIFLNDRENVDVGLI